MNIQIKGFRALSMTLAFVMLLSAGGAQAATTPPLGLASTFGILSSTYTNTVSGTTINGDLGYTTGPAVAPTVNGSTYTPGATYTQAGIDQGTALTDLNNQPCTFTFPAGAIDLAANAQFPTATYGPGVYCISGAASIGAGGITITGAGTHIFRMSGALDTVAGSVVTLSSTASNCDVWWTPVGATTLGANSTFLGTVIDDAGITIGSTVTWLGRALAFAGTVSSDTDTITASGCAAPTTATLTLTKTVVNNSGGTAVVSDFPLFIGTLTVTSGIATTTLTPGTYVVSETSNSSYTTNGWTGDCAVNGSIVLSAGDTKFCGITNDDIPVVISNGGGRRRGSTIVATTTAATTTVATTTAATATTTTLVPTLPNTGYGPSTTIPYAPIALAGTLGMALAVFFLRRKAPVQVDAV